MLRSWMTLHFLRYMRPKWRVIVEVPVGGIGVAGITVWTVVVHRFASPFPPYIDYDAI
jgi:hypothetical protein